MEQTPKTETKLRRVGRPPKVAAPLVDQHQPIPASESFAAACNAAQAYAMRIWEGQSPDLPRAERIRRVAAGLEGQNMSMDGVELPATHDSKTDAAAEAKLRAWNTPLPAATTGIV